MSEPTQLFSELMRPQRLADLTLPRRVIDRLQRMVESGSIMNMVFYGSPGLGKTSACRVFIEALGDFSSTEINGSSATGVEFVREHIQRFASSLALYGDYKLCFIDEADYLSNNAQAALRKVIEDFSCNCRFVLAVNDIKKLIPAIRSRLLEICFNVSPDDRGAVQQGLIERYEVKLSEIGMAYDRRRLLELVGIYYPDLRSIANHIEFEFRYRI